MLKTISLISLFMMLSTNQAYSTSLKYSINGKNEKTIDLQTLQQDIKSKDITFSGKNYRGFPFNVLLEKIYGKNWKKFGGIIFHAQNKYKPTIKTKTFLKDTSYLTYELANKGSFVQFDKTSSMLVNLGPFYLIWDSKTSSDNPLIYQIEKLDLIKQLNVFTTNNSNSSDIKQGKKYFQEYCVRCHALNGKGGTYARDLALPNIVSERGAEYVEKYIMNPKSVRPFSRMPSFKAKFKDKKSAAKQIIQFINFIAKNKDQ